MRRILATLVVLAGVIALFAAPASASYRTTDGGAVSDDTPTSGGSIQVEFRGFRPNSTVTITIQSDPVVLGTFTANAEGVVRATVVVPSGFSGNHSIVAAGLATDGSSRSVSVPVVVQAAAEGGTGVGSGSGSGAGSLPSTGSDPSTLVALGLVLIAVGTGVAVATRARIRRL